MNSLGATSKRTQSGDAEAAIGVIILVLCAACLPAATARAQLLQEKFWVPNAGVEDVVVANGAVHLAGRFTQVGPATGSFVGLDANTAAALQPLPEVVGTVRAATSDGAGGWYIGGYFSSVKGQPRTSLAHLDAAGNVTGWNPGTNGNIFCLARDPATGIVYAGGSFAQAGGQNRIALAAINASGVATSWNVGFTDASVYGLTLYSGTLYAVGSFNSVAAQTRNNAAAFDVATGTLQSWNPDADNAIFALGVKEIIGFPPVVVVYLGGLFTNVGGAGRQRLAAVDATTGAARSWNPGADAPVYTMALAGSGQFNDPVRIYVGGDFQLIATSARSRIAQIGESGTVASWNPGADAPVRAFAMSGNRIYVGGDFSSIGGRSFRHLAAVDLTTGMATSWDALVGQRVFVLGTTANAVFAGGEFWTVGGVRRNRLAALDLSSGQATGWNPNANGTVFALALGNGVLYAGGEFTSIGVQARNSVAAISLGTGQPTAWNPGANGRVLALEVGHGVIYAGGSFDMIGGQSRISLAALDAVSGLATSWNPAPDGETRSIHAHGAKVYAGGWFSNIGGAQRRYLAALDAATGLATSWNTYAEPDPSYGIGYVEDIVEYGRYVIAGGLFGAMGGRERSNIAAVDSATGIANHWDYWGSDGIADLAVYGQTIYVSGALFLFGGESRHGLAAIDAGTGAIRTWNPSFAGSGGALAVHQGTLYAAGFFENVHRSFIVLSGTVTDVAEGNALPSHGVLRMVPNPFRTEVALGFTIARPGVVDVGIYDVGGRLVRRLGRGDRAAGPQRVAWDGRDDSGRHLGAGIYVARVRTETTTLSAKVLRVE